MKKIVLHIDRLVLKGYAREDRHAIVAGVRDALARQLAEPGAAQGLANVPPAERSLRVDGVSIGHGAPASRVGDILGAGIAKGLRR